MGRAHSDGIENMENTCILTKSIRIISDSLTALHPPHEPHTQLVHVTCYMPHMSAEDCVYSDFYIASINIVDVSGKKGRERSEHDNISSFLYFVLDENNMSITRHYINIQLAPSGISAAVR